VENGSVHPLVMEAMRKAAVAWLQVGDHAPYPVWCLWADGGLYVVSGPGEQPAPGLADASAAVVSARGDHGGRIVSWAADVSVVEPKTPLWTQVVPSLAAKRLNSQPADALMARWAQTCVVNRLTPAQ
jgi:hypothetical protein